MDWATWAQFSKWNSPYPSNDDQFSSWWWQRSWWGQRTLLGFSSDNSDNSHDTRHTPGPQDLLHKIWRRAGNSPSQIIIFNCILSFATICICLPLLFGKNFNQKFLPWVKHTCIFSFDWFTCSWCWAPSMVRWKAVIVVVLTETHREAVFCTTRGWDIISQSIREWGSPSLSATSSVDLYLLNGWCVVCWK